MDLSKILEKKLYEINVGQLLQAIELTIESKREIPEWVGIEDRHTLLCVNKRSKANEILTWGKHSGYKVRKRGKSKWNRDDLKILCDAYWSSVGKHLA